MGALFPSGPTIVPDWSETRDEFQITRQLRGRRDDIPNYGYAGIVDKGDLVKAHAHLDALVDKAYGLYP